MTDLPLITLTPEEWAEISECSDWCVPKLIAEVRAQAQRAERLEQQVAIVEAWIARWETVRPQEQVIDPWTEAAQELRVRLREALAPPQGGEK